MEAQPGTTQDSFKKREDALDSKTCRHGSEQTGGSSGEGRSGLWYLSSLQRQTAEAALNMPDAGKGRERKC